MSARLAVSRATAALALALALLPAAALAADPLVLGTATPTIQLSRGIGGANGTPMNITFHQGFGFYYGAGGGNTTLSAWVWNAFGDSVQRQTPLGVDVRALNYNPNTGDLEVCTFNAVGGGVGRGLLSVTLNGAGLLTGGNVARLATVPGLDGSQTMPAFDPGRNRLYSRSAGNTVNVVDRNSGGLLSTITLDLVAAGSPTLVGEALGFDSGYDVFVTIDPTGHRALVHRLNGSFLGASNLPNFVISGSYGFGYANGQLFIFDSAANAWRGFRIFAATTVSTNTAPRQFNLSSFPLTVDNKAISTLVLPQTGPPDTTVWRLGTFSPGPGVYLHAHPVYASIGRELTSIDIGKGYWFITDKVGALQETGSPGPNAMDLALISGTGGTPQFNQLGNPFYGASMPVSSMQVRQGATVRSLTDVTQTLTDQVVWAWTGTAYSQQGAGGSIPASAGFWLRKVSSGAVSLIVKAALPPGPNEPPLVEMPAHVTNWDLTISGRKGDLESTPIVVGEAEVQAGVWNPLSLALPPPPPGDALRLALVRSDWGELSGEYASEYQPAAERMSWEIALDRSTGPGQIELTFSGRDLPSDMRLALTDVAAGVTWDVTPGSPLLLAAGRERTLRLTATRQGGPLATAPTVGLSAYPNPFVDRTGFVLTGAPAARLRVSIYDLSGRRVRQIEQRGTGSGEQVLIWDGRDDSGAAVSSGVYFARSDQQANAPMVRVVRIR